MVRNSLVQPRLFNSLLGRLPLVEPTLNVLAKDPNLDLDVHRNAKQVLGHVHVRKLINLFYLKSLLNISS